MSMRKEIPIVTTTDEAYLLNCYVAVYSMIRSANPDHFYKIHIFVTNLSESSCKKLEELSREHALVTCIDISDVTAGIDLQQKGMFPIQTYYRLFIPLVLPEYKKILYLDSDMCILRDVAELYNTDLDGCVIGGVRDVPCKDLEKHVRALGNLDSRKIFNAGVLLIDTEAFERKHVRETCLALLSEDYKRKQRKLIFEDNDALNLVLYERCKILEGAWNFLVQYLWIEDVIFEEYRDEYMEIAENPYIVHYAGIRKPWTDPDYPMADIFWNLAKETSVYEEIVFKVLMDARNMRDKFGCFQKFTFPYDQIPGGSKISIYAAGRVGQDFYHQMQISCYAKVVLWADKNFENLAKDFPVVSPEKLKEQEHEYLYLVIAIEDQKIAKEVFEELSRQGISKDKLVWAEYNKK